MQFYRAARLILGCSFLYPDLKPDELDILQQIYSRWRLTEKNQSLWGCLIFIRGQLVSDRRDLVFAVLGLVKTGDLKHLAGIDYTCSVGQIFFAAFKCVSLEEHTLDYLVWNTSVCDLSNDQLTPSWVPWINTNYSQDIPATDFELDKHFGQLTIGFENTTLCTQGFLFDTISHAHQNFSLDNLRSIILEAYAQCQMPTAAFNTRDSVIDSLCQSVSRSLFLSRSNMAVSVLSREDFLSCVSGWLLEDLGVSPDAIEANVPMETITQNDPTLVARYPDAVEADLDVRTFCSRHKTLDFLFKRLLDGQRLTVPFEMEEFLLSRDEVGKIIEHQGRNLFTSTKGYRGVGPFGDNRVEIPAVQTGDHIVFLPTVWNPIILRPCDNGDYTFVGAAHIPFIPDAPCFQSGAVAPRTNSNPLKNGCRPRCSLSNGQRFVQIGDSPAPGTCYDLRGKNNERGC